MLFTRKATPKISKRQLFRENNTSTEYKSLQYVALTNETKLIKP